MELLAYLGQIVPFVLLLLILFIFLKNKITTRNSWNICKDYKYWWLGRTRKIKLKWVTWLQFEYLCRGGREKKKGRRNS